MLLYDSWPYIDNMPKVLSCSSSILTSMFGCRNFRVSLSVFVLFCLFVCLFVSGKTPKISVVG